MTDKLFILLIGVGLIAFLIFLTIYSHWKLRLTVKSNWGRTPHSTRFDHEDSLKKAWEIEKNFHQWDSEIDDLTGQELDRFAVFEKSNLT